MSCTKTDMNIKRWFEKKFVFKMKINWAYVDFLDKKVELIIGEIWLTDYTENGAKTVIYQKIEPTISSETILFDLSIIETSLLTDTIYKYVVIVTDETWYAQPTKTFNVNVY